MTEVLQLYKKVGETPLECILRFKTANLEYKTHKMTYLGRLDPMAEGLLLVLSGDTRDKEKYLELDKTYEFDVLWGFSSDTYDILGMVGEVNTGFEVTQNKLEKIVEKIKNKKSQSYPPYSSRTAKGIPSSEYAGVSKPLWEWSRENMIDEIDVPTKSIKIFNLEHIHTRLVTGKEILDDVQKRVGLVKGNFRQEEILSSWQSSLAEKDEENFLVSRFTADVSSGTYVRGLAHEMGEMFDVPALAFNIKRTRVGEYSL